MPRPGSATHSSVAPDPLALLKTVGENQKQIEATRKDYIFRRKDEDQELDSRGRLKSTEVKEYEVYYMGGWQIESLLRINGKPLTEEEREKQDEEVRKQKEKAWALMSRRESGEPPSKNTLTLAKFLAADR